MKVGFDDQVFLAQRRGGVSRYFVSLVEALRADPALGVEPVLGWTVTPNDHVTDSGLGREPGPLGRWRGNRQFDPLTSGVAYLLNAPARRRLRGCDVVHHTFYHPRFLSLGEGKLRVSTVHDMIPEIYPEQFERNPHLAKADYVRRSDLVLCDSESARQDLLRIYGSVPGRVEVVHLGVDPVFRPGLPTLAGLPERYVLFVGRRTAYKDFAVLVEALGQARLEGLELVLVGGGPVTDLEQRSLRRVGWEGRWRQVAVPEADLPRYYGQATVFVFPSQYEGFGLPTLEAMASGCPTLLAQSSSLPEIGGEAARYFTPGDHDQLADLLESVVGDEAERSRMSADGVARAAAFPWSATAAATSAAYASLL